MSVQNPKVGLLTAARIEHQLGINQHAPVVCVCACVWSSYPDARSQSHIWNSRRNGRFWAGLESRAAGATARTLYCPPRSPLGPGHVKIAVDILKPALPRWQNSSSLTAMWWDSKANSYS